MTTDRAIVLPSVVLWILPPLSLIALLGVIMFSKSAILVGLFGTLWLVTLFVEGVVFTAYSLAFVRYSHLRTWSHAGGLALIAAHLLLIFVVAFIALGAGI